MNPSNNQIPVGLRNWFIVHFIVDLLVAIPLIFYPSFLTESFGLTIGYSFPLQLLGAAFFAIGVHSFLMRNHRLNEYTNFLKFKIIWSSSAIFACIIALIQDFQIITLITLLIFLVFCFIWNFYLQKLNQAQS